MVMDNSRDWAVTGVEEDRSGRGRGTMAEWPEEGIERVDLDRVIGREG